MQSLASVRRPQSIQPQHKFQIAKNQFQLDENFNDKLRFICPLHSLKYNDANDVNRFKK